MASAFFSPKLPTSRGWIWGAGPVLLLPSGSDDVLTSDKWGAGPTGLSFSMPTAVTYGLNVESTYDWESKQWSIPFNATVSKVTRFCGQLVSIGGGVRYWADGPDSGPHNVGFRLVFTLLFPR